MGNDIGAIIIGVVLLVIGVVVAIYTGIRFVAQAKLFEFLSASQGYVIGAVVSIFSSLVVYSFYYPRQEAKHLVVGFNKSIFVAILAPFVGNKFLHSLWII